MAVTQIDGARQLKFTGDLDLQTNKLVNLTDPTASQDAATKAYVDAQVAGGVIDFKESVRVASTGNLTLANEIENGDTVDGVTLSTGDRILLKNQTLAAENGIYVVESSGTPSRSGDADTNALVNSGMFMFIEEGTVNAKCGFLLTTTNPIFLGVTDLTFEKFSEVGQLLDDLVAGDALTKTGETVNLVGATSGGITVNADDIGINLDTNSGLELAAGGLSLGDGAGLVNSAGEVDIVAATSGGLEADDNDVRVILDTNSGLQLGSGGLSVGDGDGLNAIFGTLGVFSNLGFDVTGSAIDVQLDGSTISNPAFGAGISLADGASGSLLVGQGASDSTYNTVSGDMTMSSSAAFTIADSYVTDTWVTREVPSGSINGVNDNFTVASTPLTDTLCVFLNGVLQNVGAGNDYTFSSTTITFNSAPETGDVVLVNYNK